MEGTQLIVLGAVVLSVGTIAVVMLNGRFHGKIKFGKAKIDVGGRKEAQPPAGMAEISGSTAGRNVTAEGLTKASIKNSEVRSGDVTAQAGGRPSPNR